MSESPRPNGIVRIVGCVFAVCATLAATACGANTQLAGYNNVSPINDFSITSEDALYSFPSIQMNITTQDGTQYIYNCSNASSTGVTGCNPVEGQSPNSDFLGGETPTNAALAGGPNGSQVLTLSDSGNKTLATVTYSNPCNESGSLFGTDVQCSNGVDNSVSHNWG